MSSIYKDFTLELQISEQILYTNWIRNSLAYTAIGIALFAISFSNYFLTKNKIILKALSGIFIIISLIISFLNIKNSIQINSGHHPAFNINIYYQLSIIMMIPLLIILIALFII